MAKIDLQSTLMRLKRSLSLNNFFYCFSLTSLSEFLVEVPENKLFFSVELFFFRICLIKVNGKSSLKKLSKCLRYVKFPKNSFHDFSLTHQKSFFSLFFKNRLNKKKNPKLIHRHVKFSDLINFLIHSTLSQTQIFSSYQHSN